MDCSNRFGSAAGALLPTALGDEELTTGDRRRASGCRAQRSSGLASAHEFIRGIAIHDGFVARRERDVGLCLYISAEIEATGGVPVPICFGYRVYLRREQARGDVMIVLPARRRIVTDERLLPTGTIESHEMSASTIGVDELREVFVFGADRCLTIASDARRLTVESLTGFPLAQVRTVASEPHVVVEALTAAPDALSRNLFPVATPGRPYRAALRLSIDSLSPDRSRLAA